MTDATVSRLEAELRMSLVNCARVCYERKLISSSDGNLSARLPAGQLLITAAGVCKGRLNPEDLLLIDLERSVPERGLGRVASSELPMHLEVYRQRPDVGAVIHAHPVFATALTVAGIAFPVELLPEGAALLGEIPTTVFALPSSMQDADAIRDLIRDHDGILLRQHGALTCGKDLEAALNLLERIEFIAEVYHRARALGHIEPLPPYVIHSLRRSRRDS